MFISFHICTYALGAPERRLPFIYIQIQIRLCIHIPICIYIHIYTYILSYTYPFPYIYICISFQICTCTAYCIWSVIQSQSPISISLVSFQRNVAKEAYRTKTSIVNRAWRNDTPNTIGCIYLAHLSAVTVAASEIAISLACTSTVRLDLVSLNDIIWDWIRSNWTRLD